MSRVIAPLIVNVKDLAASSPTEPPIDQFSGTTLNWYSGFVAAMVVLTGFTATAMLVPARNAAHTVSSIELSAKSSSSSSDS
jgi:hypothetical protein